MFKKDQVITIDGSNLRFYNSEGIIAELSIQAAGLTESSSRAFVSGRKGKTIVLSVEQDTPTYLHLPPHIDDYIAFPVVAIEDDKIMAYGSNKVVWYRGQEVEDIFTVDEQRYRSNVFTHMWSLGNTNFARVIDGKVILSVTWSTGLSTHICRIDKKIIKCDLVQDPPLAVRYFVGWVSLP